MYRYFRTRHNKYKKTTVFAVVFLILTNETNNNMKKEIGLVLSGGGTKGIAEAGVLKFLEEKNIFPF